MNLPEGLEGLTSTSGNESQGIVLGPDGVSNVVLDMMGVDPKKDDAGDVGSDLFLEGDELDIKIKTKIWTGVFVEFGQLLPRNEFQPKLNVNYLDQEHSQMAFTPSKVRQPANIMEWF